MKAPEFKGQTVRNVHSRIEVWLNTALFQTEAKEKEHEDLVCRIHLDITSALRKCMHDTEGNA